MATVGQSVPRVDGLAKVTGQARYLDDLPAPAWFGCTVRSPVAHGILRGFDRDPAFPWHDVVVVDASVFATRGGHNVVRFIEDDQPALVALGGTIRHAEEPLALIAAPTKAMAFAARAALTPRIDRLPAVLSVEAALASASPTVGTNNIYKEFLIRKGHTEDADIDAVFAGAAHVIDGTYTTGAQEQMYIEPQAMRAVWDGDDCTIHGSMQCPFYVHKALVHLLGSTPERVIVAQTVTGGGFGGKEEYPSILAAHCALLAREAGRDVKMVYERDEDIAATTKRHPSQTRHRMALSASGDVLAIDVDVVMDGGAYLTLSPVVLSRGVLHAAGPYKCPMTRVRGRAVFTNTPPHGAFRGFGAPQTTFPYERQMAKAARLLGEDPIVFRERNALRLGDTTATSQRLDLSVGTDEVFACLHRVAGSAPTRVGHSAHGTPVRRGRGVCFYFHGAGFTGSGEQRLAGRAEVAATAKGIEVRASSTDMGQGATTMFAQIAADALGIRVSDICVVDPDTSRVPDSGPTVASRTAMVVGGLVERAATELRQTIDAWIAAHAFAGTLVAAAQHMAASHDVVVQRQYEPPPGIVWDDATYTGSAYPAYGWAACLVDVSIDDDTCEVTVDRCVQIVDVGKALNPTVVKGQIEGGTVQALGWALCEYIAYKDGRVANASMTHCIVPTFVDAPDLETHIIEVPYPFGPSGAKGVGELPMDGPAAAVANAIEDALGVAFDHVPILPEHVAATRAAWSNI